MKTTATHYSPLLLAAALLLVAGLVRPAQAQDRPDLNVTIEPEVAPLGPRSPGDEPASNPVTEAVADAVEGLYDGLNSSEIPSGVLIDRVVPVRNFGAYDGTSASGTATAQQWGAMYEQLYEAAYEKRGLTSTADIEASVDAAPEEVVPLLMSYAEYDEIDDHAYDDYRLNFDKAADTFVDAPGAPSPYSTGTFFSVAPARTFVYGTNVTFAIERAFYTTNTGVEPSHFDIDFGDGAGFRRVDWGNHVSISYGSLGYKEIEIRAFFPNETLTANARLRVTRSLPDPEPDRALTDSLVVERTTYEGLDEDVGYQRYGFYGDGNGTTLQKPVVVLDGFDPGDAVDGVEARGLEEIYDLVDASVEFGDGTTRRVVTGLRRDGYDLFVLNYDDGGISIGRNAFTLVHLLDFINEETGGRKPITVIGPSMGGVVTRYALAYMESQDDRAQRPPVRLLRFPAARREHSDWPAGVDCKASPWGPER